MKLNFAKHWCIIHVLMIIAGISIIVFYDPIIELTHGVLKIFISFMGMILVAVGNMGVIINIVDHRRIITARYRKTV
jgi:hypothetical protein